MHPHRVHLGYSECVDCSSVKKYSSHTIYPHKTGGYIQPVTAEQSDNLNRLDRRGVSGGRKAKGIVADKSWDRFLESYLNPPPPKKKYKPKPIVRNIYIPIKEALQKVINRYDNYGYQTQILAASIRHPLHLLDAAQIGADVATVPPSTLLGLFKQPLTENGIAAFTKDAQQWATSA